LVRKMRGGGSGEEIGVGGRVWDGDEGKMRGDGWGEEEGRGWGGKGERLRGRDRRVR
jgi:hypothetical protein